jgi:hypothetical protein
VAAEEELLDWKVALRLKDASSLEILKAPAMAHSIVDGANSFAFRTSVPE